MASKVLNIVGIFFMVVFPCVAQENKKPLTPFEQALADLYTHNPHLLHQASDINEQDNPFFLNLDTKKVLSFLADGIPLIFFLYKSYNALIRYHNNKNTPTVFQKTVSAIFPSIVVNTPHHVNLFLLETEFLLQAYLLKLMLKMILFCLL